MVNITWIQESILPLQKKLYEHTIYRKLNSLEDLKKFMSMHVFVVWDFMNLLTALQKKETSVSLPWTPPRNPTITRFLNELKLEEESDIIDGEVTSHFHYYVKSMTNLGIDTAPIKTFQSLISTTSYESLISSTPVPLEVVPFFKNTYDDIKSGIIRTAASFTFGRETLIPNMFIRILEESTHLDPNILTFKRYLERHIELDGNEHGDIALKLIQSLCGDSSQKWEEARQGAHNAIMARIRLYDAIEDKLA
jgi:hypothetical protein